MVDRWYWKNIKSSIEHVKTTSVFDFFNSATCDIRNFLKADCARNDLNPVPIRRRVGISPLARISRRLPIGVKKERDVPHRALSEAFTERHAELFKTFARRLDVIDGDGDMPKAPGLLVPARVLARSPVVVRELEHAWSR